MGSRGLHQGAPTASSASPARIAKPSTAPRWRASRRAMPMSAGGTSSEADARVGDGIGDVDENVDQYIGRGNEQHAALHEREVLGQDAADDEPAEAWAAEDGLHDDRAGEEIAELKAED